jgi:hypothetical protein
MDETTFNNRLIQLKLEIAATNTYGQYDYMKDYRSGLQMALEIMEGLEVHKRGENGIIQ